MYIEVLKHEFTHDLENRRLYKKFKEYLFNSSENFIKFCEEEINELKKKGIIREAAEREMICNFVSKRLLSRESETGMY